MCDMKMCKYLLLMGERGGEADKAIVIYITEDYRHCHNLDLRRRYLPQTLLYFRPEEIREIME